MKTLTPSTARLAALTLTYTDPADIDLREEITKRGAVAMAEILAGTREMPQDLADRPAITRWADKVSDIDLRSVLATMDRIGIRFITPEDDEWPAPLNELQYPPFGLYLRGNGTIPDLDAMIAIVGSRDATGYGQSITGDLAAGLAGRKYTVLSGGQYGIEASAHRAALAGAPAESSTPTIAVLACGVDRFYPAGNEDLLRNVASRGLLISEVPPGSAPTRGRFLARNRIIAALSSVTVVVEARWRSGALNTAQHANALGRQVGGVPGSVYSANSAGVHRLLKEGNAVCVTDTLDVLELSRLGAEEDSVGALMDEASTGN